MDLKSAKLKDFSYNLYYVKWPLKKEAKMLCCWRGNFVTLLLMGMA